MFFCRAPTPGQISRGSSSISAPWGNRMFQVGQLDVFGRAPIPCLLRPIWRAFSARPAIFARPSSHRACYFISLECLHQGRYYNLGYTLHINCNKCICRVHGTAKFEFDCEQNVCLIRPELISGINDAHRGWRSSNYSLFWGKTLEEGIQYRLGTFKPLRPTMDMTEIHPITNGPLPETFDSRHKWRNLITPVRDQGDCGSSWAFSSAALASDRLAIESLGQEKKELSPQHLLSCQRRGQRACRGGHLDKAWYFMRKKGITTTECFPYLGKADVKCPFNNGNSAGKVRCPTGTEDEVYFSTPPYRVGPKVLGIMISEDLQKFSESRVMRTIAIGRLPIRNLPKIEYEGTSQVPIEAT
ncbi:Tubulointerstitial nephritis antigen-like [Araneus ventricosus]|uniref:Tubulointerstitial nephritis antigen-like n=1 Tax=Araneus ventricosus TaxID=182803 RepID=A0A4Y2PP05_ARAVE|nr:Tubulointerstitial nephritis antigen-like [Araneus ventricosus]